MDVRERRLQGSEAILWEALSEKKYWTRAAAAVGLANFNIQISLQTLEQAIGKERSELVADFFERLINQPTPGEAFVLRQAIRLLDEKGRLVVLRGIARTKDPLRDLYLAAASQDPGQHIQKWLRQTLAAHPIAPGRFNALLTVVKGEAGLQDIGEKIDAGPTTTPGTKKHEIKAVDDNNVDASIVGDPGASQELDDFSDSTGAVEIYDEKGANPPSDTPDASTFDYK